MQKGIKYKGTTAMPGSQLHKFLSEKKLKEAEKCYKDTEKREQELMQKINERFGETIHG